MITAHSDQVSHHNNGALARSDAVAIKEKPWPPGHFTLVSALLSFPRRSFFFSPHFS